MQKSYSKSFEIELCNKDYEILYFIYLEIRLSITDLKIEYNSS